MTRSTESRNRVAELINRLADDDHLVREKSRQELIGLKDAEVSRQLVGALLDTRSLVRWEAAKALEAIADPVAAPALMHALEDEDADVRWVAAEGLIALKGVGLKMVLSGLQRRAMSLDFRECAHHVLRELKKRQAVDAAIIAPVLSALEHMDPGVATPLAAYQALMALQ